MEDFNSDNPLSAEQKNLLKQQFLEQITLSTYALFATLTPTMSKDLVEQIIESEDMTLFPGVTEQEINEAKSKAINQLSDDLMQSFQRQVTPNLADASIGVGFKVATPMAYLYQVNHGTPATINENAEVEENLLAKKRNRKDVE